MKISQRIIMTTEQTWQLLTDQVAQQEWLGPHALVRPAEHSRIRLVHEAGSWRTGVVETVKTGQEIQCRIERAAGWPTAQQNTHLSIKVEKHENGGSEIIVEESGLLKDGDLPTPAKDAEEFWNAALARLRRLAARIGHRRNNPRQAVIVIHGIGEQEPGATLRRFVAGCFGADEESWSKPDRASRLFELRRITLKATDGLERPRTDVYELYWAHIVRDTTLSQVASWLRQLLFRWPVPRKILPAWLLSWFLIVLFIAAGAARFVGWSPPWIDYFLSGGVVFILGMTAWRLLGKSFVLNSVGDAVRYLTPRPDNIAHRQAIREAGVDLLDTLHRTGIFDRIVIVGHSLGSVIANDIITHYWIQVHEQHLRLPKISNKAVTALERALGENDPVEGQKRQHDAWKKARANGLPWLITDLVTVGSPLSTASFLMAHDDQTFERAKLDRELPTCPPVAEMEGKKKRVTFDRNYTDRFGGRDKTISLFHHAAPFAVTRWTNLHFKSGLLEDPIGGPVSPQLGHWIRDIALKTPKSRRFFLHSHYWAGISEDPHVQQLINALDLNSGYELTKELEQHSPLMYLRGEK